MNPALEVTVDEKETSKSKFMNLGRGNQDEDGVWKIKTEGWYSGPVLDFSLECEQCSTDTENKTISLINKV